MNRKIMSALIVLASTVMCTMSCTLYNARDWSQLEDRRFYFDAFTLYCKGIDKKSAFSFMKNFPVGTLADVMEKRYAIEIDRSAFEEAIARVDGDNSIKVFGVVLDERFTWESGQSHGNRMELEYSSSIDFDSTNLIQSYEVTLKTNGRLRAIVSGEVSGPGEVPDSAGRRLGVVK